MLNFQYLDFKNLKRLHENSHHKRSKPKLTW
jgi:hypothetical protein